MYNYFLGTPNNSVAGSAAILKPMENGTTLWVHCNSVTVPNELLLENRGLALTGADAQLRRERDGGDRGE